MAAATRSVVDFLRGELHKRRDNPPDYAFAFALRAQVEGRPLTDTDLIGFTFNLFIGGLDTVSTNMGLQMLHLSQHPEEDRKRTRLNSTHQFPSRIPSPAGKHNKYTT